MICVCLGGYFLFGKLVSEILEGESHIIDTKILMFMRDPSDRNVLWGPGWFQEMMRDITGLGGIGILTLITIACAIYFFIIRKANLAFYILVSVGTGVLFSNFLKSYFDRPRPDLVPYGSIIYTASLPSGHALMSEPPPINESGPRVNLDILWTHLRRIKNGSEEIYDGADYWVFAAGRGYDRAWMHD